MDLQAFRRELHQHPELAGAEEATSGRIQEHLNELNAHELQTGIGGHGLAASWHGDEPGPALLLRADMDALPIEEQGEVEHRSGVKGVGHLCGHDGHSTILLGLAQRIAKRPPQRGRITLLFQPAEETGQGAAAVIADPKFEALRPDLTLGLHNLPGWPAGQILLREGPFAMASRGLIVRLHGRTSHAAYPEQGRSPARAVSRILPGLQELSRPRERGMPFRLATIIHTRIGEIAFGTTPGEAVVMATLRASTDAAMKGLAGDAEQLLRRIATDEKLRMELEWVEEFPATVNDRALVRWARPLLQEEGFNVADLAEPFRWSEDVGHFCSISRMLFFGLGAGEEQPPLHAPDYDFPDEIIEPGIEAFDRLRLALEQGIPELDTA